MSLYRPSVFAVGFDRVCALAGLIVLAPLFILVACCILIEDGRPVFYLQKRIGQGGKVFWLCKFRSMRTGQLRPAITASGDARILRVGRVLRKHKIDELPQLWNVLTGEMSLVGPRPEVPPFVDLEDSAWREVLAVPPGITDIASLVYRNEEALLARQDEPETFYREEILPAKLALNLRYLERRSFWLDLKLIVLTIRYSLRPTAFDVTRVTGPLRMQAVEKAGLRRGEDCI